MELRNGTLFDPEANRGDCRIGIGYCNVTNEYGKVIQVLANTIDFDLPDGTSDSMQVWVTYGAEGLQQMMRGLAEAPFPEPPDMPDPESIRANLKYYWKAVHANGEVIDQWPGDKNFSHIRPLEIVRFFLLPKDSNSDLPSYCLDREEGFLIANYRSDDFQKIDAPIPKIAWHLEYCFRPAITLGIGLLGSEVLPVHVRHELGWRVDQCHGDSQDTWFILHIEDDDGSWQFGRIEPEDSRHFQCDSPDIEESEPKQIQAEVHVVDPYGSVV